MFYCLVLFFFLLWFILYSYCFLFIYNLLAENLLSFNSSFYGVLLSLNWYCFFCFFFRYNLLVQNIYLVKVTFFLSLSGNFLLLIVDLSETFFYFLLSVFPFLFFPPNWRSWRVVQISLFLISTIIFVCLSVCLLQPFSFSRRLDVRRWECHLIWPKKIKRFFSEMIYSKIVFEEKTENCNLVLFPILNNLWAGFNTKVEDKGKRCYVVTLDLLLGYLCIIQLYGLLVKRQRSSYCDLEWQVSMSQVRFKDK